MQLLQFMTHFVNNGGNWLINLCMEHNVKHAVKLFSLCLFSYLLLQLVHWFICVLHNLQLSFTWSVTYLWYIVHLSYSFCKYFFLDVFLVIYFYCTWSTCFSSYFYVPFIVMLRYTTMKWLSYHILSYLILSYLTVCEGTTGVL